MASYIFRIRLMTILSMRLSAARDALVAGLPGRTIGFGLGVNGLDGVSPSRVGVFVMTGL
jgi:hypothetical protein